MTLKQRNNETENLRQQVKFFRNAIDMLSCPLSSALENIVFAERLSEKFNVSLPLIGFMPFDTLKLEANNVSSDKTPQYYRNNDSQLHYPTKSRDETRKNTTQEKGVGQDRGIDRSQVKTSSKKYGSGNIVEMNDTVRSTSRDPQFTVRDTSPETPADHNKKQIRQNLEFNELTATTANKVFSIKPSPGSSDPCQIQAQGMGSVENTLIVVDNLAQEILHDEHHASAKDKDKETHSDLNQRSQDKSADQRPQKERILSAKTLLSAMTPLHNVPKGEMLSRTEQQNHPQGKNKQASGYRSVTEETLNKESHFNEINSTSNNGCKALSNSLSQIGIIADALLQSPTTTGNGVKVKEQNIPGIRENDRVAWDGSGLSVSDFNNKHNMKFQQTERSSLSNKISNATEPVLRDSILVNSIDKDAIATFVNEVLVEQAKRHGVDLS